MKGIKNQQEECEKWIPAGAQRYRAFVGPPEKYDLVSALQFSLLTFLGLREHHFLLDIGCGSLRGGKLFIPYLLPERYFGIEPEQWLIEEGIRNELGENFILMKRPFFSNEGDFRLSIFDRKFNFILAQSIFSHASQDQIRKCLSEAKKVMESTSIFVATFVKGEWNYEGKEWTYPGCVTYTSIYMKNLVEEQGFVCKFIDWPHPNQQSWMILIHPENEPNIPEFNNASKMLCLENDLKFCKERLRRIQTHPLIKYGMKIKRFLKKMK